MSESDPGGDREDEPTPDEWNRRAHGTEEQSDLGGSPTSHRGNPEHSSGDRAADEQKHAGGVMKRIPCSLVAGDDSLRP